MNKLIKLLTPADKGIIAAALNDAKDMGLGDDGTQDYIFSAIFSEVTSIEEDADAIAYYYAHN